MNTKNAGQKKADETLVNSERLHVGQHNSLEKLGTPERSAFPQASSGNSGQLEVHQETGQSLTWWYRYESGECLSQREKQRTLHTPLVFSHTKTKAQATKKGEKQILSASGVEVGNFINPKAQAKTHCFWVKSRSKSYLLPEKKKGGQKTLLRERPCANIKQMSENAGKGAGKLYCTQHNLQIQSKVQLPWGRRQKQQEKPTSEPQAHKVCLRMRLDKKIKNYAPWLL